VVYECNAFAILWTARRNFMEKSLSLKKTLEFTYSKEKNQLRSRAGKFKVMQTQSLKESRRTTCKIENKIKNLNDLARIVFYFELFK
jgi:hypothetical protein